MALNPLSRWCGRGFLFCASAAMAVAAPAAAQDLPVGFALESLRVSALIDGWLERDERAPVVASGNSVRTFAHLLARVEVPLDFLPSYDTHWLPHRWWLGAFADSQVWASGDGARALAFANNAGAGGGFGIIPIALRTQSLRRQGVSLAGQWALPALGDSALSVLVRGKWFDVTAFKSASADGTITVAPSGAVGLQATSGELELGGQSPFFKTTPVVGQGFSLDAALLWQGGVGADSPRWVQASVRDWSPPVRLPSVLQTTQAANSQMIGRDAEGYLQVRPLLSGQYRNVSVDVAVEPQFSLTGGWGFATGWQALAGVHFAGAVQRWHVGVQHGNSGSRQGLGWSAKFWQGPDMPPALELAAQWRSLRVGFQADQINSDAARVWGWSLAWVF